MTDEEIFTRWGTTQQEFDEKSLKRRFIHNKKNYTLKYMYINFNGGIQVLQTFDSDGKRKNFVMDATDAPVTFRLDRSTYIYFAPRYVEGRDYGKYTSGGTENGKVYKLQHV